MGHSLGVAPHPEVIEVHNAKRGDITSLSEVLYLAKRDAILLECDIYDVPALPNTSCMPYSYDFTTPRRRSTSPEVIEVHNTKQGDITSLSEVIYCRQWTLPPYPCQNNGRRCPIRGTTMSANPPIYGALPSSTRTARVEMLQLLHCTRNRHPF